jgi:hypothetical protein
MSRCARARVIVGIVLALSLIGAPPAAAAPRAGPPINVDVSSLEEFRQALDRATPGSVIRLAAGTYSIFADDPPFTIKGVQGLPDRPIVIQGTRGARLARPTIIDGGRSLDGALKLVERFRLAGARSRELEDLITQNQYRTRQAVNCLVFEEAAYVVIEDLTVRNCWPTSFVFLSSRYVTLRAMTIVGSTYAFFVDRQSDHFLVEDSVWTQDDSGYARDESGYSGRVDLTPKPGRMWDTIPWGVAHHGSRAHLNGGLISSFGTVGSIVIRRNVIRNTYNGVRFRANRCEQPRCNVNIEIYDNDFQFIRDNPVEPEDQATNWWIFHNRIYNGHSWFSLDGVGGGPIYIFGNLGWFDDKPSRRCVQRDWAGDQTLQADGRYAPTSENECSRSRTGKVVKLAPGPIELKEPIYVFNNSWYVRAPVVDGGAAKFRAWNNATLFCEPNVVAPGMCVAEFEMEKSCVQSLAGALLPFANRFPVDVDRVPFIDCFAASPGDEASHGISNHPDYPDKLAEAGYQVRGLHGDPGFVNASRGDFRLRADSLARGKGCTVARGPDGSLSCPASGTAADPDIGAYQGNALIEGPDYMYEGDEQPRVMKTTWRIDDGSARLEIAFSTTIQDPPDGARIAVRFEAGETFQSEPCRKVRAIALDCRFAALRAAPPTTATLLVPRSIKSSGGKAITLWAARASRIEFQR